MTFDYNSEFENFLEHVTKKNGNTHAFKVRNALEDAICHFCSNVTREIVPTFHKMTKYDAPVLKYYLIIQQEVDGNTLKKMLIFLKNTLISKLKDAGIYEQRYRDNVDITCKNGIITVEIRSGIFTLIEKPVTNYLKSLKCVFFCALLLFMGYIVILGWCTVSSSFYSHEDYPLICSFMHSEPLIQKTPYQEPVGETLFKKDLKYTKK